MGALIESFDLFHADVFLFVSFWLTFKGSVMFGPLSNRQARSFTTSCDDVIAWLYLEVAHLGVSLLSLS